MKKLELTVNSCFACLEHEVLRGNRITLDYCIREELRRIPNIREEIPDWCPLEDVVVLEVTK